MTRCPCPTMRMDRECDLAQTSAGPGEDRLAVQLQGKYVVKHLAMILTAAVLVAGCEEKPPMTVAQFLENEAALYGTLERCQTNPGAGTDAECRNARAAAERISVIEERAARKAREQAFASARQEYRQQLDRERALRIKAEAEAKAARLERLLTSDDEEPAAEQPEAAPPSEPPPPNDG